MLIYHKFAYIKHRITSHFRSIHRELSRYLSGEDWILLFYRSISRQLQSSGNKCHTATRLRTADQEFDLGLFSQSNKPAVGEARQSGNCAVTAEVVLPSR